MRKLKNIIYVDALALVPEKKSGIGTTLMHTVEQLSIMPELEEFTIYLVVPLGKAKYVTQYVRTNVRIKTIFLPARLLEALLRSRLLPPMDWFLGSGIYVFPNYRNWPLWRSKSLTYIYDISFILYPDTVHPKNQKYLKRYVNLWTGRADKVITISHEMSTEIEKYLTVPYTKIEVVYCGVDHSLFKKSSKGIIEQTKKRHNIQFDKYFLYVGNIEPRKNLKVLLEAYTKLPDNIRQQYGLVLIGGDGWLNHELQKQIETVQAQGLSIQKVKNYVPTVDLPHLYSGATLLIHPANYEGFGITPLEAMACETPVLVSEIPAIREVVQDAGFYFDPLNSISLVRTIKAALNDKKLLREHVDKGLSRVKELSWQNTAQALHAVIDEELAKGPVRWPSLKLLKSIYKRWDNTIRAGLGEKDLKAYQPPEVESTKELQLRIYDDFLHEQPSSLQNYSLKVYLKIKHLLATVMKKLYRVARRRAV